MDELWQEATRTLRARRFAEASVLWSRMLHAFRDAVLFQEQSGRDRLPAAQRPVHIGCIPIMTPGEMDVVNDMSTQNQFIIYDRAFSLHGEEADLFTFRPLVAIYNAALCYHLHAFTVRRNQGSACRHLLQRASCLYEHCSQVLSELVHDAHGHPDSGLVLLFMACANNHGQIKSHFCEHQAVTRDVEMILQSLILLLGRTEDTDPRSVSRTSVQGIASHDLSFFVVFRFLPDTMKKPRLAASA